MIDQHQHATSDELAAFSAGRLSGPKAEHVEQHISECDLCCETLMNLTAAADTFVNLLQRAGSVPPHQDEQRLRDAMADHERYALGESIGKGGMGTVYRGTHRLMDRQVAIKLIQPSMVRNPEAVERFRREVKAAASLSHPNIVTAYDAEQAGELHFLAMEYVRGTDLASVIEDRGPLPVDVACDYIRQTAEGLEHAHQANMIHRDIKPHNLMLSESGTIRILDFGLAALVSAANSPAGSGEATVSSDLTASGTIMGTPDYISPEQATDAQSADARSDVYSLGATFHFLLTGQPPFPEGNLHDKLAARQSSNPANVSEFRSDVPQDVAALISEMMDPDPQKRPQSAADVASQLVAVGTVKRSRLGKSAVVTGITVAVFLFGMLLSPLFTPAPALIQITPNNDLVTLVIKNKDQETVAEIKGAGKQLLPNGQYLLHVASGDADKWSVTPQKFDVNGNATLNITVSRRLTTVRTPAAASRVAASMEFARIKPARFTMGTPLYQKAVPNERVHDVTLTYPYEIGRFEVTQEEFRGVMNATPSAFQAGGLQAGESLGLSTNRFPVENVTWHDAVEFCRRLSDLPESRAAGFVYRLPTEAEWEFACRAGSVLSFHFGNSADGTNANVNGRQPHMTDAGPALGRPALVGSYEPNAAGIHDMHGNVWEWCSDWFSPDYYTNSPPTDPHGPDTGTTRVIRGGSWDYGAFFARAAVRDHREPEHKSHSIGFRVVRVRGEPPDE